MIDPLLVEVPASLETRRLLLRPPRSGDGPTVHPALVESIDALRRFLGFLPWVAEQQTLESAERYCRNGQANHAARKDLPFLLFERSSGRLVGCAGLHRPDWSVPKLEVGFWIRSGAAGQGYVTEAVEALVQCSFGPLGAMRIELVTDEQNTAARRVADRCHFQLEGVLRSVQRAPDGSLRNTCVYARLPDAG